MSSSSVSTCPRLQQQGTRQLTEIKEVCWAKKYFNFSREWVGRSETKKNFGAAEQRF